jgi:hypothetical protein
MNTNFAKDDYIKKLQDIYEIIELFKIEDKEGLLIYFHLIFKVKIHYNIFPLFYFNFRICAIIPYPTVEAQLLKVLT